MLSLEGGGTKGVSPQGPFRRSRAEETEGDGSESLGEWSWDRKEVDEK
jgi:hypothetical protein